MPCVFASEVDIICFFPHIFFSICSIHDIVGMLLFPAVRLFGNVSFVFYGQGAIGQYVSRS